MAANLTPVREVGISGQLMDRSPQRIPKIVHQLWKNEAVPARWAHIGPKIKSRVAMWLGRNE